MDTLIEGTGRVLLQALKWLVIDAFIEFVLYGLGYGALKILTLGKYPRAKQDNDLLCIGSGAVVLAVLMVTVLIVNTAA